MTLTEQQIETLALAWPWEYVQTKAALLLAERQGWPLDDTVRGLDRIAEEFGAEADPLLIVGAAIAYRNSPAARRSGTAVSTFLGPS